MPLNGAAQIRREPLDRFKRTRRRVVAICSYGIQNGRAEWLAIGECVGVAILNEGEVVIVSVNVIFDQHPAACNLENLSAHCHAGFLYAV